MSPNTKITIICPAAWLLLTLAYFAFYYDALLSIFTPLLGGALVLASIPLVVYATIVGIKKRTWSLLAVPVVVAAVAITGWLTPVGTTIGARCKLWREIDQYQAVVAQLAAGADTDRYSDES